MRLHCAVLPLTLSLLLPSCSAKRPTALVMALSSELRAGANAEIDEAEIHVSRHGAELFSETYAVPQDVSLPGTLTFQNGSTEDASTPITIHIVASLHGAPVVTRDATLGFVDEATKLLRLRLEEHCIRVDCAPGSTCIDGSCASDVIDPSTLPDFTTNADAVVPPATGGSGGASGAAGASGSSTAGASGKGGAAGMGGASGSGGAGGAAGMSGGSGAGGMSGASGSGGATTQPLWPMLGHDAQHTALGSIDGPKTNTMSWTAKTGLGVNGSPAVGADGTIYTGTTDSTLLALHPDGSTAWEVAALGAGATPAIAPDGIIVVGTGGFVTGFDATGVQKWTQPLSVLTSSPVIGADGAIYFTGSDKNVYALNADGTTRWTYPTQGSGLSGPAVLVDGTVYALSQDDPNLYALNADGTLRWMFTAVAGLDHHPAVAPDGTIYVVDEGSTLYAVNPDGSQKWTYDDGQRFSSQAIGPDGTIYVEASNAMLYAIHPGGTLSWKFPTGAAVNTAPAVGADGTIYVSSPDGNVYAIEPGGTMLWSFAAGTMSTLPALGVNGTLYASTDAGNMIAIGP